MAVCVGSIPLFSTKWPVFCVLVVIGAFEALFSPAEQAKLKEVVANEQLNQAVPFNSAITQLAKIIGPGLSGVLVGLLGANIGFYLDAASFVLSTVFLLLTGFGGRETATDVDHDKPSFTADFRLGWQYVSGQKLLLFGALMVGLSFGGIALLVHADVQHWLIPATAVFAGLGAGLVTVPFQTMVQQFTPDEYTGRVFGLIGSMTTGAALCGPIAGGLLITASGPVLGFLITAVALIFISIGTIWFTSRAKPFNPRSSAPHPPPVSQ